MTPHASASARKTYPRMMWLPFALAASVMWAISNLIDQELVRKRLRDPATLVALAGLSAALPAAFIVMSGKLTWPDSGVVPLAAAAGVVGLLAYLPYFHALRIVPASTAMLLWNLSPVFVAIGARSVLHERLALIQYLALALLVGSAMIAAYADARRAGRRLAAISLMAFASILVAVEAVLQKAVFERSDFMNGYGWISVSAVGAALLGIVVRPRTRVYLRQAVSATTVRWVAGGVMLDLAAVTMLGWATSLGPVSVVRAVSGLQPLFVLALVAALAKRHRDASAPRRSLALRSAVATALAVTGLWLIGSVG